MAYHYGIHRLTIEWSQCFLSNHSQQAVMDGPLRSEAKVTSGVPQGGVHRPLLLLIFINDLTVEVQSSVSCIFAVDCILYQQCITSPYDSNNVQTDLD